MTDMICGYGDDRDEMLVSYLYDDLEPRQRAAFEAHLTTCLRCRAELSELGEVRSQLQQWAPPEPARALTRDSPAEAVLEPSAWARLSSIPAWAQVAAALLFLGVGAGLANLDVRYDRGGLTVRTGWSRGTGVQDVDPARAALAPWRADLAALERQLRTEFRPSGAPGVGGVTLQAASAQGGAAATTSIRDAEIMRRVRVLVEESERQQQRELALRVAQVIRDVNAQREADLVKIDRSLGLIQNNTGMEAMKQRELLNYLVRVSQRQ